MIIERGIIIIIKYNIERGLICDIRSLKCCYGNETLDY